MKLFNAAILLFIAFMAAMFLAALIVEADSDADAVIYGSFNESLDTRVWGWEDEEKPKVQPTSRIEAELAWEQIQADVKVEKAKPVEKADKERADKLKDDKITNVLAEQHGKTLKVELYDKDWKLCKTRYEREGWIAEESKKLMKVGGKEIVREWRVKIWRE